MSLLDSALWNGKIYLNGWRDGGGGTGTAVEPATGATLARVGAAGVGDVSTATEQAARAQRSWAGQSYDVRAGVLRRAAQLFVEHEDEIADWVIRESGAIRPFAQFQIGGGAAEECWEAAALASHCP